MASHELKLLIDKRENRVLFAEAEKDFVDYIFHLLCLPLGKLVNTLYPDARDGNGIVMPGCFWSLFDGVFHLDDRCLDEDTSRRLLHSDGCDPCYVGGAKGGDGGGYVKSQTYMVMDNLVVKPMSIVSVLSLIGPAENLSNFEVREVDFGRNEAGKLLKAFVQSRTVLTDVYLNDVAAVEKGVKKTQRV